MIKRGYLTDRGKEIFDVIYEFVKSKKKNEPVQTFRLSMLANEIDKYERAAALANQEPGLDGMVNVFDNGTVQVNAYHTIMKDCYDKILKDSVRFGIDPESMEKVFKGSTRKDKKKITDGL